MDLNGREAENTGSKLTCTFKKKIVNGLEPTDGKVTIAVVCWSVVTHGLVTA